MPKTINGEQLDPQAYRLFKAIREKESGGNYNAVGDNATSTGAFQFQGSTWKGYAKDVLGDENAPMNKGNQNQVAYKKIKQWKDAGWTPAQIAAAWNAGEQKALDGTWKENIGFNKEIGVAYNTPQYVGDVLSKAKALKSLEEPAVEQSTTQVQQGYAVPSVAETREQKIARINQENVGINADLKKNTGLGYVKNFGKALVSNLAPSEVGLGQSISAIASVQNKPLEQAQMEGSNIRLELAKRIREKEAQGEDATKLKQTFNNLEGANTEQPQLPSTAKVAGQLAGTALDTLTAGTYGKATAGLKTGTLGSVNPTVLSSVLKPTGIFTKRGAGKVATGAGIGYGFDVTQGLQGNRGENREGAKSLIPGAGTVIGAAIPLATETAQSITNRLNPDYKANQLIQKRQKELNKLDSYQSITKAVEKGKERGIDIKKVLSDTDVLHGAVDKTGNITTKGEDGAIAQYTKQFIDGNEDLVREALRKEKVSVSPGYIENELNKRIEASNIQGKALKTAYANVKKEVAGYKLRAVANGNIPIEVLHNAKVDKYNNINFFTDGNVKSYDKTVAKALKKLVEENTKSVDVEAINQELSKHFAVIDYLNRLDGKKVAGGKLGKYFAQTLGGMVGSKFGPVGTIVGAELGGRVKGNIMSRAFSGKTGKTIPEAEIFTKTKDFLKREPLQLPQSSNNLGSRSTNQSTTIIPTNIDIPPQSNTLPQKSTGVINTIKDKIKNTPNKQGGFIKLPQGKSEQSGLSAKSSLPKNNTDLITEAKKYKSAEEFANNLVVEKNGVTSFKTELPTNILEPNGTLWDFKPNKQKITEPVLVSYNKKLDKYIVLDGHHRLSQALINNQKSLPTRLVFEGVDGEIEKITKSQLEQIWKEANATKLPKNIKETFIGKVEEGYKPAPLTTKLLRKLEGKTTVSKQFISDLTNSPDLKQVEKDLIRAKLEGKGDKINVADFGKEVEAELLPLKVTDSPSFPNTGRDGQRRQSNTRYENISLPDELRGNVKNYKENVYESPIATSAGDIHFTSSRNPIKNYFGHTRIEDMADNKTRRVIEVQSDLFQKGNLEREFPISTGNTLGEYRTIDDLKSTIEEHKKMIKYAKDNGLDASKFEANLDKSLEKLKNTNLPKDLVTLQQYNNPTAHFRMVREEIQKASKDGKDKLQFPTGETALKIEGLGGRETNWFDNLADDLHPLKQDDLIVGKEIRQGRDDWIITDVLGDGKFKAVPKNIYEKADEAVKLKMRGNSDPNYSFTHENVPNFISSQETFDISGKVDTNNPIYKFYNKELQNYLKNNFKAQQVVDEQGVSWLEVPVKKEYKDIPIEAFGIVGALGAGSLMSDE